MRLILAARAVCFAMPVAAQNCGPREQGVEYLRSQYGETVQGLGMDAAGTVVEVWANLTSGTWTITASTAAGLLCVIGSGDNYVAVNEPQGVDG